jgi:formamidopyrimidine-DNA glycosylase
MPELPEVETTLRGIEPHIDQQTIIKIVVRNRQLRWPIPADLEKKFTNQVILKLQRRGKYILFQCTKGTLILHLGMSGRLRILLEPTEPQKHDHVDIHFSNGKILRLTDPRRFGALLYTASQPQDHELLAHLGPEPLTREFTGSYLAGRAKSRQLAVKSFIMDSKIVVGVGNIYAAESLFMAGIHPELPAGKVSREKYDELAASIKTILKHAIKQGGTTLKDFSQSDGKPGYFSIQLQVYGKAGEPCARCRGKLQLMRIGQRSTVFCPACQPYALGK